MENSASILNQIVKNKKRKVEGLKKTLPLSELVKRGRKTKIRNFSNSITKSHQLGLIAEIKKASPSEGELSENFDPIEIAKEYESTNKVSAISVLTEEAYFGGKLEFIKCVKRNTSAPLLRKDFIFDEYQIYESYLAEADALLLIVAILESSELKKLINLAHQLGISCLVEVHNEREVAKALSAGAKIIGVNSRNLKDFSINKALFKKVFKSIPTNVIKIAESGLSTPHDLVKVKRDGADGVLIGTAFMKAESIAEKVHQLFNNSY